MASRSASFKRSASMQYRGSAFPMGGRQSGMNGMEQTKRKTSKLTSSLNLLVAVSCFILISAHFSVSSSKPIITDPTKAISSITRVQQNHHPEERVDTVKAEKADRSSGKDKQKREEEEPPKTEEKQPKQEQQIRKSMQKNTKHTVDQEKLTESNLSESLGNDTAVAYEERIVPDSILHDDIPVEIFDKDDKTQYHVIFSTGCSVTQDWQSYIFFYHVWKSGQPGKVTRIASGCNDKDSAALERIFKEQIKPMQPDRFFLHQTPNFANVRKGYNFKYYNKPYGLRHWMEKGLGYPRTSKEHDDTIIILLDPDQVIVRPITKHFKGAVEAWRPRGKSKVPVYESVEHGRPFAQQYGFGMQWKTKVNASYVCNCTDSRVDTMDIEEAKAHYPLGPPYVVTARDMYAISVKWTDFVGRIHDNYPHLLAEMFGYSFAAAHLNLPHRVMQSGMVSDPTSPGEGWKLVDDFPLEKICTNPEQDRMPHVLHYCHRYMVGKWFIGKYRLRKDFISCDAPLLVEPPSSIVEMKYAIAPGGDGERIEYKNHKHAKRNAFVVCQLIPALNNAAKYFKRHNCPKGANFNHTYVFHDTMEE